MSNQAFIIDAVRTPMGRGKAGGALSGLHATDLLTPVLRALIERNNLDPGTVDDVIAGCVSQAGEQSAGVGRFAWLAAGYQIMCRQPPSTANAAHRNKRCISPRRASWPAHTTS